MKRQEARRAVDLVLDGGDLRDAPREIAPAVSLLRAAAGLPDETTGVDEVPARIAALIRVGASSPPPAVVRPPRPFPAWRPGIAVGTVAALLAGSTGLAMADMLPASVQHALSGVLGHVGLHVPDSSAGGRPSHRTTTPGRSGANPEMPETSVGPATTGSTGSTAGISPGTPVGPNTVDGSAVRGLCQAVMSGADGAHKSDRSVAMANLKAAADKAGKSVNAYCAPYVNAPTTTSTVVAPAVTDTGHTHTTHTGNPGNGTGGNGNGGGSGGAGQNGATQHTSPTTPTTTLNTVPSSPTGAGTSQTQPSTTSGGHGKQSNPGSRS